MIFVESFEILPYNNGIISKFQKRIQIMINEFIYSDGHYQLN
ncbi:hypothetical protein [Companilactobacillus allii]|nr:hypothetical protein [Companilactobacillus allii]